MKAIADRVRRLNAAVNAHDLNPIGDMYADDAELTWPGMPTFKGRQAVVAFYAQMFGAFPDVQVTLRRIVEQGDAVAVEYASAGTNGGPLPLPTGELLPATNKHVDVQALVSGSSTAMGGSRRSANTSTKPKSWPSSGSCRIPLSAKEEGPMIRFRTRLLTLVLAAGAALVAVQPVAASSPISVAGTFFFVAAPVPSGFRMADGNAFVTLSFPAGVVTGDITGNFTEQLHVVTHPDGSQNLQGNATCTCAVGGRTGTLVFDNIAGTTNTSGVSEAHFVLSGSGGLADLHGQGTAIVSPTPQGPFGVYTAQYSFG